MASSRSPHGHHHDEDFEKNISSQQKPSRGGWSAAIFIIFVEMAERFAYFGMSGNLITYLTNELHEPIPMAAKNVNTWVGVSSLLPILGAFIADSFFGRFNTILVSSIIYCMDNVSWAAGFGILTGSMAVALILFLLGIKKYQKQGPLGSPFTKVAQVFVAAGRKRHTKVTTDDDFGEYFIDEKSQQHPQTTLVHTNQFRFLDKAMVIDHLDASSKTRNPWRLCSLHQVEQVKLLLRLIPIWMSCLMFAVVQSSVLTFFTKQGSTMIRTMGSIQIPQASLQIFIGFTIIVAIPIYDRVFVPAVRKVTGHPSGITILQRIGTGLLISIISMVVAALVEAKRIQIVRDHNLLDNPKAIVPMRIWWLIPQYMICGLSDAFTFVGMQELFYVQMPEAMRSLGAAFYLSVLGVGFFISTGIITLVQAISAERGEKWITDNINRSHLDYFYWVIAALSALNLCLYVLIAKGFVYKQIEAEESSNKQNELT